MAALAVSPFSKPTSTPATVVTAPSSSWRTTWPANSFCMAIASATDSSAHGSTRSLTTELSAPHSNRRSPGTVVLRPQLVTPYRHAPGPELADTRLRPCVNHSVDPGHPDEFAPAE